MATTLPDDIKAFLALHHRWPNLTEDEQVRYAALRERVQLALRPEGPPEAADDGNPIVPAD